MTKKLYKKIKNSRGFVILFAVTLSAIFLSIALGVSNITFREIRFSTSAKDTNNAFFAADSGVEQALLNEKSGTPCADGLLCEYIFLGFGNNNQSCAIVTVDKIGSTVVVVSKGYNIGDSSCNSTNPNRVERQVEISYLK
ncbi:MAG: hypothetical protein WC694_00175 [Candidatus Paceibacterota bacterium]|jgi:hypothetical protein